MSSFELHATSSFATQAGQAPPSSSSAAAAPAAAVQSYVVPPNSTVLLSRAADAPPRTLVVTSRCPSSMLSGLGRDLPGAAWKLEDYDLHRQLYKGKASLLYSATCKASGTRVALKLYRKARLSELNWYQVAREVCLHSRLSHPHVVDLFAAFEDKDHVYLVQEYASGGDLYEALKRAGGKLKESAVAGEVVAPCLDAVAYLHSLGIIHRDIKPENILLCPVMPSSSTLQQQSNAMTSFSPSSSRDCHHSQHPDAITTTGGDPATGGVPGSSSSPSRTHVVKLADFGLSIDEQAERPVTRAGTLDYMAPEVLLCPEKAHPHDNKEKAALGYGASVDVWALGVLAYELVTGRPPFEQETRQETCECIARKRPRFPSGIVSEGLKSYATSSLAKSALKRPSAAAMRRHAWVLRFAPLPAPTPSLLAAGVPSSSSSSMAAMFQQQRFQQQQMQQMQQHGQFRAQHYSLPQSGAASLNGPGGDAAAAASAAAEEEAARFSSAAAASAAASTAATNAFAASQQQQILLLQQQQMQQTQIQQQQMQAQHHHFNSSGGGNRNANGGTMSPDSVAASVLAWAGQSVKTLGRKLMGSPPTSNGVAGRSESHRHRGSSNGNHLSAPEAGLSSTPPRPTASAAATPVAGGGAGAAGRPPRPPGAAVASAFSNQQQQQQTLHAQSSWGAVGGSGGGGALSSPMAGEGIKAFFTSAQQQQQAPASPAAAMMMPPPPSPYAAGASPAPISAAPGTFASQSRWHATRARSGRILESPSRAGAAGAASALNGGSATGSGSGSPGGARGLAAWRARRAGSLIPAASSGSLDANGAASGAVARATAAAAAAWPNTGDIVMVESSPSPSPSEKRGGAGAAGAVPRLPSSAAAVAKRSLNLPLQQAAAGARAAPGQQQQR